MGVAVEEQGQDETFPVFLVFHRLDMLDDTILCPHFDGAVLLTISGPLARPQLFLEFFREQGEKGLSLDDTAFHCLWC